MIGPELWTAVDRYFDGALIGVDDALAAAQAAADAAGLPAIAVSPLQGKLLHFLAKLCGARRILEIGTLAGYSGIWLARALPPGDGRLVTIESEVDHARIAAANFTRAGLSDRIDLRVGRAIDLLPALAAERAGPFDFTFVDADKANNAAYFDWSVRLSKPGALIVVDNVVRNGRVIDEASEDAGVRGTRALVEALSKDHRVTATAVQTVGAKGYDGFVVAMVQ
jgi:predicted O-methyltransferase YrrM